MSEVVGTPKTKFKVTTVETVYRTYTIYGDDEKIARKRLHLHWNDPESLREGLVTQDEGEEVKNRQFQAAEEIRLTAVREADDKPMPKPEPVAAS
jgi:hypothetical protein